MSRGNHNTDSKRYYDWVYYAYHDCIAANILVNDKRLYSVAAFHCQQCIEKALKGYLLYKNRRLLDGHNLTWLCKQAAMMDDNFVRWIGDSAVLNRYYIETRYPADDLLVVGRDEVEKIISSTEDMLDFICAEIHFDYNSFHKRKK